MEFEITAGFKVNSKLLYSADKQLFQKTSEKKSTSYYKCYVENCSAKIKLDTGALCCSYIDGSSIHTHGTQEYSYNLFKVDNKMKIRCSTEKKRPRDIFDEECVMNQEATQNMQYAKRHRTFKYHQKNGLPQNPKTLEDVKAFFEDSDIMTKIGQTLHTTDPKLFYQDMVITPTFAYAIFSSEAILANLPVNRSVRIDCTFKCVPKSPFTQLLILQIDCSNHSFPALFVLMTRKTEAAYAHLFNNIESRWKINPMKATTDYEKAIKNALRKQYPGIRIISCWFHYCQALAKNSKKMKNFRRFIKGNDEAQTIYRKLMCLPLMRADNIRAAFKLIKEEAFKVNKGQFTPFLNYIEEQWLQREGPNSITVYMEEERTNNPMESYNSVINYKIPAKGCFYKFVALLRVEEFIKSRDYHITMNGGTQLYRKPKKCYREKNERILLMQHQFETGKINLKDFFDKCAALYVDDINADDEVDDVDDETEQSNETDENCERCHIRLKDTMFQPCLHLKYCAECVDALLQNDPSNQICPECNLPFTGRLHVFL